MITTRASVNINKGVEDVFAFICRLENYPLWQSGLIEVSYEGTVQTGTKARGVSSNLGVKIEVGVKIIECTSPETLIFSSDVGPLNFTVHYDLAGTKTRTKVTCLTTLEAGRVYSLAEPLLEHIGQVKVDADLKTLKSLLESESQIKKDLPASSRSQA